MKSYKQFIRESIQSDLDPFGPYQLTLNKLNVYRIKNYNINSDGSIDVEGGGVDLNDYKLIELPLKFGKVIGDFYCGANYLTSLVGSPSEVVGNFSCNSNKLTSLQGCPKIISGSFYCENNNLTSLVECPYRVDRDFYCNRNKLTSLEGGPSKVGGNFICSNNNLTSLEGYPEMIGGDFYCQNNNIRDFRGISEFFEGNFYCDNNPIEEIWSLFEDVRCIHLINEFDVIQDGVVILDRLEEVFHQLEMNVPKNLKFNYYEII
jgi:hypothetical protein